MRMMKKGGFTPSDRRLDRRKVACAALAVLLISATAARANTVDFVANPALSTLTLSVTTKASSQPFWAALGAGPMTDQVGVNQDLVNNLGKTTSYYGHMYADFTSGGVNGNIQLVPGGQLYANNIVNGSNVTQLYQPSEVLTGLPGPDNNAKATLANASQPASYALSFPQSVGFGAPNQTTQRIYGLQLDAKAGNAVSPLALNGNFNMLGNNLAITNGISDWVNSFTSFLDTQTNATLIAVDNALKSVTHRSMSLTDHPTYSSLTMTNSATGNWDGTTLTLNVHTSLLITGGPALSPANIVANLNGIPVLMQFDGTLVFNAYGGFGGPVPEPSTVTLLGFGVAGILTYAYRARKHKALVA